jgi:DNA-directed RNA polymerase subunit M/transcription elongation factor TFIIS
MSWNNFCKSNTDSYLKQNEEIVKKFNEWVNDNKLKQQIRLPKPSHLICRKCKSNLIWIDVRQVRSGDEGATTFCKCSQCNYCWKMN